MFYLAPDSLADGEALVQHGWPPFQDSSSARLEAHRENQGGRLFENSS